MKLQIFFLVSFPLQIWVLAFHLLLNFVLDFSVGSLATLDNSMNLVYPLNSLSKHNYF